MSLFDLIRYPVTDKWNQDCFDILPERMREGFLEKAYIIREDWLIEIGELPATTEQVYTIFERYRKLLIKHISEYEE